MEAMGAGRSREERRAGAARRGTATPGGFAAGWAVALLLALGWLAAAGCATGRATESAGGAPASAELARYDAAVADAAVFRSERQVADLVTLDGPVEAVSWKTCSCATCAPCPAVGELTLTRPLWITVVPEVRDRCRGFAADRRVRRLQQLLGLPPEDTPAESTWFLELRVADPADVFRPCTDPDPADPGPCTLEVPADVPADHVEWMAGQMLSSWQVPGGYPWTRLGYTYDWSPEAGSVVGPSELVVKKGARIEVIAVTPTEVYCAP
jgi:hypothetical protein